MSLLQVLNFDSSQERADFSQVSRATNELRVEPSHPQPAIPRGEEYSGCANNSPAGPQTLVGEGQTRVKSIWTIVSQCMFGAVWLPGESQIIFPSWKRQNHCRKNLLQPHEHPTHTLNLRTTIRATPSRPNAVITANCTARAACNTAWLPLQQVDFIHLQCTKHNYLVIFLNEKMNLNY